MELVLKTKNREPQQDHRPHDYVGELIVGSSPNRYKIELSSLGRAHTSSATVKWDPTQELPPKVEKTWTFSSKTAQGGLGATRCVTEKVTLGGLEVDILSVGRNHNVALRVVPCV